MRVSLVLLPLMLLLSQACTAQPAATDPMASLRSGDYATAETELANLMVQSDSSRQRYVQAYAEVFRAQGRYDEGIETLTELAYDYDDAPTWHALSTLHRDVGAWADVAETASRADQRPPYWPNIVMQAEVAYWQGEGRLAGQLYSMALSAFRENQLRTPADLRASAASAARLEEFHDANEAYRLAYRIDSQDPATLLGWADLFRSKYNNAEARRTYEEVLAVNPRHPDALVGRGHLQGFAGKEAAARAALEVNPNHAGALNLWAGVHILDADYAAAAGKAQQALGTDPVNLESWGLLAAARYLQGDSTGFAEAEAQVQAITPRSAPFYLTLAENVSNRFRYPAAEAFTRQAVRQERRNPKALAEYGLALLRNGKPREARRYLESSFERDGFNLFVGNTLTLLDQAPNFRTLQSEHFMLYLHESEVEVLGPLMLEQAEAAYAAFTARYPYRPEGKILIEAYNDSDDFAVRVGGVPHLGLLGVAFGDIIALDSPQARKSEPYNWARTLWHELAHTMAIGVTDFQLPRWFTEGLSVYEERLHNPAWDRDMDFAFYAALDQDKLYPIGELDRGFTRPAFPGQVLLSYYHASKVIEYLAEQGGFEAVVQILELLGQGIAINNALVTTTGQELEAMQTQFDAFIEAQRTPYQAVLGEAPVNEAGEVDVAQSENPFLKRLGEGERAAAAGNTAEAIDAFEGAIDLFPRYVGPQNPYVQLAALYAEQGQIDEQIRVLTAYLALAERDDAAMRTLAELLDQRGAAEQAMRWWAESLNIEPYRPEVHERLAALYAEASDWPKAIRAREAVVALRPNDAPQSYLALALTLDEAGEPQRAKRAVLMALEDAPTFRDAQKLLLRLVDQEVP
ncbi:MAG: peptidase MA family metallohydrolase [Bacteroidota bacterium]